MLKKNLSFISLRTLQVITLFLTFSLAPLYANLAQIQSLVPEASDYSLVYELEIGDTNDFSTSVPYTTDNSASIADGSFNKIAYFMELDGAWVWVSMDAFTAQANLTGVPNTPAHTKQETVTGMNVSSSAGAGLTAITDGNAGRLEFWHTNYSQNKSPLFPNDGSDSTFDFNDTNAGTGNWGSMQVHNVALGETIFAFNAWNGRTSELGIGSPAFGAPDWTFTGNAASYTTKKLYVLVAAVDNTTTLNAFPESDQFYPRDNDVMHATLPVSGEIITSSISGLCLRILQDGVASGSDQPVNFLSAGHTRTFSTTVDVPSVLANVSVLLIKKEADGSEQILANSSNILVGDTYIIQGQSNADATAYVGSANANISPYIYTYGDNWPNGSLILQSLGWKQAQGDGSLWTTGGIGQWGLKMANELMNAHQIPIAIINGAHPGQAMSFFQRNDADKDDLNTNYGRLYYRVEDAGMRDKIKGIFFYQGESDLDDETVWSSGWADLYADWKEDYPNVEHYYVIQLREGTAVTRFNLALRDAQRLLQEQHPDITALSTNGLDGHDGLHYQFTEGYEAMGVRFAKILSRDFYGAADDPNIETIYPVFAELIGANKDRIRIAVKRPDADITFEAGAEADFQVVGAAVSVNAGSYENGFITLQLSGNATGATDLLYTGRRQVGEWVTTAEGNSLISFSEPLLVYTDSDNDGLSDNEEAQTTFTHPNLPDTDGDGIPDNYEVNLGLDPNDPREKLELCILNNSGSPTLRWPSQEGLRFNLRYSENLATPVNTWTSTMITDNNGDYADHYLYDISSFLPTTRYFYVLEMLAPVNSVTSPTLPLTLYTNTVEGNGLWSGTAWSPTSGPAFLSATGGLSPTAGTTIMFLGDSFGGSGTTTHSFSLGSAPPNASQIEFSIDVGNLDNGAFPSAPILIFIQDASQSTIATLTGTLPASAEWQRWTATLPVSAVPPGSYTAHIQFTATAGLFDNAAAGVDHFRVTAKP